jgi:hypothetical protein
MSHTTFIDETGIYYYRGSDAFWYTNKEVAIACGWNPKGAILDAWSNTITLPE